MATREGIYVGGHEIVRRYVGDKIVWQKKVYNAILERYSVILVSQSDGLSLIFSVCQSIISENFPRYLSNGKIKLDDTEALFSSMQGGVTDNRIAGNFYHLKVTFLSETDKNKFERGRYPGSKITIFEKTYR